MPAEGRPGVFVWGWCPIQWCSTLSFLPRQSKQAKQFLQFHHSRRHKSNLVWRWRWRLEASERRRERERSDPFWGCSVPFGSPCNSVWRGVLFASFGLETTCLLVHEYWSWCREHTQHSTVLAPLACCRFHGCVPLPTNMSVHDGRQVCP